MKHYFIDKMNASQLFTDHHQSEFAEKRFYSVDLMSGEISSQKDRLLLEGSYSSKLNITFDGLKLDVYGNPSRFNRVDNLQGYKTIDECFAIYNLVLKSLNLPLFTKCTKYLYLQNSENQKVLKTADGAIIKHLDFTRNLAVGQGNERPMIEGLATQTIGRSIKPHLYPNHETVDWYGQTFNSKASTYRYTKVYSKLVDLIKNRKKNLKNADELTHHYYQNLIDFVEKNGVIREEHSFKRPFLLKKNLFAWGLFDQHEFQQELEIIDDIRKRLSVNNMKLETITEQLLETGICKTTLSANSTQMVYLLWLHGQYIDRGKSQYRIHKSRLLKLGIDISVNLDISHAPLRLKNSDIIEVKDLELPDWYRQPKPPHLFKVA